MMAGADLLSPEQAAARLGLSLHTLKEWRKSKPRSSETGPRFYRVGRQIRYRRDDLEAWLESRAVDRKSA